MDKHLKIIINTHKHGVRGVIKSITGTQNEDLEQEVFIKAWKNLDKYEHKGRFGSWIKTIAANISRDFLRSKAFKKGTLEDADEQKLINLKDCSHSQEERLESENRQRTIAKAIEGLRDKQREVIMLFEIEGFSLEEISKKLKCPTGTVKSRLFNARKELAQALQDLL